MHSSPTLRAKRPLNGKTPYVGLSDDDALQANRMYKCAGKIRYKMTLTIHEKYPNDEHSLRIILLRKDILLFLR